MNKTEYMVFWIGMDGYCDALPFTDLTLALNKAHDLRNEGMQFVTMAAENVNQVGKMGVDTIKNGILPDGQEYVYKTGRDRGRDPR